MVCHASAWDVDNKDDLRIKMCIKVNADDFVTIHHELGHNYYQRAYNQQPFLYLNGANDGFHEAIGDFIALSVTPGISRADRPARPQQGAGRDKDTGLLLRQAMDKVAFLPFGLLVDKWRWGVFDGSITPANYNQAWVGLKQQYQGIVPPVAALGGTTSTRAPSSTSRATRPTRATSSPAILQFQFYKAACDMAGLEGPAPPLQLLRQQGGRRAARTRCWRWARRKPWPDALEAFTGSREMSAKPMLEYFAPLQAWLEQQNRGKQCGW